VTIETRRSYCRFCHAACAIEVDVDVESNRALVVRGDRTDPMFEGYTCIKGRHLPQQHHHPDRLRASLMAERSGSGFSPIETSTALDQIAARLAAIIERHGPRSLATYCGTAAFQGAAAIPVAKAFHSAIGSPSFYSSVSIDQPAKSVAPARHGAWQGGMHSFTTADVIMTFGNNTLVSSYGWPGTVPGFNPFVQLRRAKNVVSP
jgi:anaerobic selenocysteine-containing dehydrogenase